MKNYIGITGFKSAEEVRSIADYAAEGTPRIMYGVLTSPKNTLDFHSEGRRRAATSKLESIFSAVPLNGFPMLHHCTYNRNFVNELDLILGYNSIYDKGLVKSLQINQRLPEISEVIMLRKKYPELEVVIQLEPPDLENPKSTAKKLIKYEGLFDYIIIDPSRGAGIALDFTNSLDVLNAIKTNAMPVIAGGLHPENVKQTVGFFKKNYSGEFCIDAEGRLRTPDDNALDIGRTKEYVKRGREGYVKN
jgi:phosphoribosylanthranilate isomerase